jgi:hypothetical protein
MNIGTVLATICCRTEHEGPNGGYEKLCGVVEHGKGESAGILKRDGLRNTF